MDRPELFLIDSFGYIFRAYHARARSGAPPMRTSRGLNTEAVFIFHNMLVRLLKTYTPAYIAAIFESEGPTLREQEFADYKANRPEAPPELLEQIPYVRRLIEAMGIPVLEYPGYEADDIIGTLARQSAASRIPVVIVSSDKDMLQLVDERVSMLDPRKDDLRYDPERVREFLGVAPAQVADLLALKGDASDNIPGAPGIGDKGARELIARFGSVEAAMEHAAEIRRKSYRESLQQHRDQILLSKRLATIETAVPIEWSLEQLKAHPPDPAALRKLFEELEFFSLLRKLHEEMPPGQAHREYPVLETASEVTAYLDSVGEAERLAVAVAASGEGELRRFTVGLAAPGAGARRVAEPVVEALRPVFERADRRKTALDAKAVLLEWFRRGVEAAGFTEDPTLYAFLLTADPGACSPEKLIERWLGRPVTGDPAEQAEMALQLAGRLAEEVDRRGFRELYETIDAPLIAVLARMERTGIRIERAALAEISRRLEERIGRLQEEIYQLAGKPFNVNSPQQLGKILYEEMGLPAPRRSGKKKGLSTAADVLEGLAAGHPIAARVLDYRQLVKLKGTYVDALPALIHPETGRLHTTFNQTGAATGRLSSASPNLQNIPIRSELGREIRAAFVPAPGWKMIVADYSQIELRLLAHFSGDEVLVDAFRRGEDIHTRTAAEVFGLPPIAITPEQRRNAKAVNFGIIYGLSSYGLSRQIGISREEAERYIQSYFERYRGVKRFLEETIAKVRETGVTRTLFGRERPIPEINSRNANARGFAERTAVNTPLQGTAADLIKLAMIRIDRAIRQDQLRANLLLQVHDELVLEAPPGEVETVRRMVKREMEQVHELKVPLVAETGIGDNWRDAR